MKYINAKLIPYGALLLGFAFGGLLMFVIYLEEIDIVKTAYFMTVGVSVIALLFSLYQARYTAEHNRLQLTPRLIVRTSDYTDLEKYDLFKVEIINNGLGPAEILDAYFEIKGIPRRFGLSGKGIEQYLDRVFGENHTQNQDEQESLLAFFLGNGGTYYQENEGLAKREFIASGTRRQVLSVSLPDRVKQHYLSESDRRSMRNKAREALKNTQVTIIFQSLYEEENTYKSQLSSR